MTTTTTTMTTSEESSNISIHYAMAVTAWWDKLFINEFTTTTYPNIDNENEDDDNNQDSNCNYLAIKTCALYFFDQF